MAHRARGSRAGCRGGRPGLQARGRGLAVQRLVIDMALDVAATERADQVQLVQGFHAFRRGFHAQGLGQADDRGNDRAVAAAIHRCPAHEGLVDLDLVERGLL